MQSIRKLAPATLNWVQPKAMKREFELRSKDELFGALRWEKACGSLALAVSADGQWTLKRSGFLNPRVTARLAGSDQDIAVFRPSWTGSGVLELGNGRRFRWVDVNFWRTEWVFRSEAGEDLVRFKSKDGLLKLKMQVELAPAAKGLPEVSLLAALGMYLLYLMREDAAAASVA